MSLRKRLRAAWVIGLLWSATLVLVRLRSALEGGDDLGAGLEPLLVRVASWAVVGGACWLALVGTITVVEHVLMPGSATGPTVGSGRLPGLRGPRSWDRMVLAMCGVALGVGATATSTVAANAAITSTVAAHAAATRSPDSGHDGSSVRGLLVPSRPVGGIAISGGRHPTTVEPGHAQTRPEQHQQAAGSRPGVAARPRLHGSVRVVAGDTLWSLAVRALPTDTTPARVAELTTRIYRLNRAVIGADPDVIQPGTVLRIPLPREANPEGEHR